MLTKILLFLKKRAVLISILFVMLCVVIGTLFIITTKTTYEIIPCKVDFSIMEDGSLVIKVERVVEGVRNPLLMAVYDVRDIDEFLRSKSEIYVKKYSRSRFGINLSHKNDELVFVPTKPKVIKSKNK